MGRGLRELGETVASSFTGTSPYKPGGSSPQAGGQADVLQKGIVTILDIEVRFFYVVFKYLRVYSNNDWFDLPFIDHSQSQ